MRTTGFDKPLYILPFDHRGSFQTKMFGWKGELTAEQTALRPPSFSFVKASRSCLSSGKPR